MTTPPHRDRPLGETSGSDQRPARRLAASSMAFDLHAELASLKQELSWERGDRNGRTLAEEAGLRVTLIAMKAATKIKEHHTDGRVSIHTLAGQLRIQVADETLDLGVGHVLILDRGVPHDVEAVGQESAFLLTVALPGGV